MNRAALIISFIFLCNPAIHVIDPMPDFIGWLILLHTIRKAKQLSVQTEYAAAYIKKMVILSLVSIACIFVVPISDGTMILTITFAINVMKLVWGIPAFKYFYSGIAELGALYDAKSIYKPITAKNTEGIKTVESFSLMFLVASAFLNTFPELFELTAQTSEIYSEGHRTLASFKPLFYAVSVLILLILAVIWLYFLVTFFSRLCKENEFFARIDDSYNDKIVKTFKHSAGILRSALFIKGISGIFMFCVISGSMNRVPAFIYPLLTIVAVILLAREGYKSTSLNIFAICSFIVSAASYVLGLLFSSEYIYDDIFFSFEAYDLYLRSGITVVLQTVLFAVSEALWLIMLSKIAQKHAVREILAVDNDKYAEQRKYEHKAITKNIIIIGIMFAFICIGNAAAYFTAPIFEASWIVAFVLDLVWFVYSYSLCSKLRDGIENRYL